MVDLLSWFRAKKKAGAGARPPRTAVRARHTADQNTLFGGAFAIVDPDSPEEYWRTMTLENKTLELVPVETLAKLLTSLSPEVSAGHFMHMRFGNPGYEIAVTYPDSERPYKRGQQWLAAFIQRMDEQYGAFGVIPTKLLDGQFMRGAAMAELVIGSDGRTAVDLVTPDPITARFKQVDDPERGKVWQLGQWRAGKWVSLDMPTIAYLPVDPAPGAAPYGRPLISPALFTPLFLLGLLHDIRRVVSQQGYNRLDINVNSERLFASMPTDVRSDPAKQMVYINQVIAEIQEVYNSLEPDDAYIHTDVVEMNKPMGTATADSLRAVDTLIRGLERMAARALKVPNLFMGISESVTETHAKYMWFQFSQTIRSLQHNVETVLSRLLTLGLQADGIQAQASFKFANLSPDKLNDARVEAVEIENEARKYEMGWTSQDEASEAVTGHAADVPEPRTAVPAVDAAGENTNAERFKQNGRGAVEYMRQLP